MIIIQITNPVDLIRRQKGNIAAAVAPFIIDITARVEQEVITQIQEQFAQNGVEAKISIVSEADFAIDTGQFD